MHFIWQEDGEDHKHDERVTSVSIEVEGQLHPEAINMWLQVRPIRKQTQLRNRQQGVCWRCALLSWRHLVHWWHVRQLRPRLRAWPVSPSDAHMKADAVAAG